MADVCLVRLIILTLFFACARAQNCPAAPFPGCGAAGQCSGECVSGATVPTVLGCQVPNDCTNGYCVTNVCLTVSADATSCGGRCVPATGGAQTYCINGVCLQATGTACTGKCHFFQEAHLIRRFLEPKTSKKFGIIWHMIRKTMTCLFRSLLPFPTHRHGF